MTSRARCRTTLPGILALAWAAIILALPSAQAAWDRSTPLPVEHTASLTPKGLGTVDADGYWVFGAYPFSSYYDRPAIARMRNDGSTRWLAEVDEVFQVVGVGAGEAVSTGRVDPYGACGLTRWSADGVRLWAVVVDPARSCDATIADGNGGAWVTAVDGDRDRKSWHVLADGEILDEGAALNAFLGNNYVLVADPDGSGLYAVGQRPRSSGPVARIDAAVVAIDRHGHLRWQLQVPDPGDSFDHRFDAAVVGRDGHLYVAGHLGFNGSSSFLRVSSFSRDGQTRFARTLAAEAPRSAPMVALFAADSGVHLLAGDNAYSTMSAYRIHVAADGTTLQGTPFDNVVFTTPLQAAVSLDGRRLAFVGLSFRDFTILSTTYLGGDGNLGGQVGPREGYPYGVGVQADGSVLLVESAPPILQRPQAVLSRFDSAGNPMATPDLAIGPILPRVIGGSSGTDGTMYRVTAAAELDEGAIEMFDGDGHRVWRSGFGVPEVLGPLTQSQNAGVVCSALGGRSGVDASGGRLHLARLGVDGSEQFDHVVTDYPTALALAADGGAAVLTGLERPNHLRFFDPTGAVLVDREVASDYWHDTNLFNLGNGAFATTYLETRADGYSSEATVTSFDVHRGELWTVHIDDDLAVVDAQVRDGALVLLTRGTRSAVTTVLSLDLADGHLRWRHPTSIPRYAQQKLAIDPITGDIAVASVQANRDLRVLTLRSGDGRLLNERTESCQASDCTLVAIGVDTDRHVHLLAATGKYTGMRSTLFRLDAPFQPPPPLALDTRAIDGAWYPEYASGQGFVFDYIASAGVLFAPWFTYTVDPVDDPSGLRWYSLQGNLVPGATAVDLDILENAQGRFAEPPITTARKVGSAQLHYVDCDHLSLDYKFAGAQDNPAGRMTLTRLTAPLAPCGATTKAILPSQVTTVGVDPRLSGSWYEPAQSGQGFMFTFQPGRELFGAWFTYDPAGLEDDYRQQQWFTLQSDPAASPGTSVVATIYQTLGGSIDRAPTANTRRVGQITLTVQACDRIAADYHFDASDLAGRYAGRSGTLALQKLGGCTP